MKRGLDIFMDMIKLCSVTFASNLNFNEKKVISEHILIKEKNLLCSFLKKKECLV